MLRRGGQFEVLADRISELEGIRWGRRGMVRAAILGLYDTLLDVVGGARAAGQFWNVLVGIADAGLHREDDALYDDSTPRPPEAKSTAVPEEVALRGLGSEGASIWPTAFGASAYRLGCALCTGAMSAYLGKSIRGAAGCVRPRCTACLSHSIISRKG